MLLRLNAGLLRLLARDGLFRGRIGRMDSGLQRRARRQLANDDGRSFHTIYDDDASRSRMRQRHYGDTVKPDGGIRRETVRAARNRYGLNRGNELRNVLEHFSDQRSGQLFGRIRRDRQWYRPHVFS